MENWKEKYDELNNEFTKFKKDYEEFIHLAAHDLDSPLRKLSTFSERFDAKFRELQDDSAKLYLSRINNSVEQMRAVVDGLYHLSLVIAEKPVFQNCDLKEIVGKTMDSFQEEIREKNISFETNHLPMIWGNGNQLMLLFKNLLDNAIKFSKKDGAKVNIHAEILTDEENSSLNLPLRATYCRISVADNGVGFRQDQAINIFQPFVRLYGKSEIPGSGLGLSICKKIVENHKGLIWAEGLENSGARFVLILPQKPE